MPVPNHVDQPSGCSDEVVWDDLKRFRLSRQSGQKTVLQGHLGSGSGQLQAREAPKQKWQNSSGVKSLPIQGEMLITSWRGAATVLIIDLTPQLCDTVCALSTLQMLSSNWEAKP